MTKKPGRSKGTGSVRNRGTSRNPRWFAYYFVTVGGKRRQRSQGPFPRKVDAEAWLREEIRRRNQGREISPDRTTVAELLDAWLATATPRLERNTVSEYRRQVEYRLKPHLGAMLLADLRPTDILVMLDELRKPGADRRSKTPRGLSETTLQHTLQALRTALDWGVRHRLAAYNQASDVDRPKRERKEMAIWTADELSRFMGFISGKRFFPLLRLAAFTGMRRSELLGLLWRDVDLDASVVRVRRVRLKDGYVMFTEERQVSPRPAGSRYRPRHRRHPPALGGESSRGAERVGHRLQRQRRHLHHRGRRPLSRRPCRPGVRPIRHSCSSHCHPIPRPSPHSRVTAVGPGRARRRRRLPPRRQS